MKNPIKKLKRGGIAYKWLIVTFLPTLATVILAIFTVNMVSRQNYQYSAAQAIEFRMRSIINSLPSSAGSTYDRYQVLLQTVEHFSEKDRFEYMVLDHEGKVLVTSSGFSYTSVTTQNDYSAALKSSNGKKLFVGHTENGTHIIASTQLLDDNFGDAAAIRFVCSMAGIDARMHSFFLWSLLIGVVVLLLVVLTGSFFVTSLVQPLEQIENAARLIAAGDLEDRIENKYSGEIGELCDTINDMASELERSNKMKNDFVSSVSHELRTPLTSIKGWSETLNLMGQEDPVLLGKGLEIINSETDRLKIMVEDLLDFSRLEAHSQLSLHCEVLDFAAELEEAALTVTQRAKKLGIEVKCTVPDTAVIVNADRNRLKQVFANIFDNAIKYSSRRKSITVNLTTSGDFAIASIKDRGPGIPKDEIGKVTDRYYRAKNSTYGTGIGLSVVNEIVTAHGGQLLIDSELGHGTTVSVALPLYNES